MRIEKGEKGISLTWQEDFPKVTECDECSGMARIAFAAIEENPEKVFVQTLHENKGVGGFWPHDAIAVAVYFCPNCFRAITLWNQA